MLETKRRLTLILCVGVQIADMEKELLKAEEKDRFYKAGWEARGEHSTPSPATKEFMTKVEMKINAIEEKLKEMPTRDEMALCLEKAIDKVMEKAETKFASKITEKIVYGMVGVIMTTVLIAIVGLVIVK